jgi:hypothetical protein
LDDLHPTDLEEAVRPILSSWLVTASCAEAKSLSSPVEKSETEAFRDWALPAQKRIQMLNILLKGTVSPD